MTAFLPAPHLGWLRNPELPRGPVPLPPASCDHPIETPVRSPPLKIGTATATQSQPQKVSYDAPALWGAPAMCAPAPPPPCATLPCFRLARDLRGVTANSARPGCWSRAPGRGGCVGRCRGVGLVVLLRAGRVAWRACRIACLSLRAELPGAAESGAVDRSVGGLRPPARAARVAGRLDPVKKL